MTATSDVDPLTYRYKRSSQRGSWFLVASIFLHVFGFLLWQSLPPLSLFNIFKHPQPVKSIELVELPEKWRTVGKKNGVVDAMTPHKMPLSSLSAAKTSESIMPRSMPQSQPEPRQPLAPQQLLHPGATNWAELAKAQARQSQKITGAQELRPQIKLLKDMVSTDLSKLGQISRGELGKIGQSGLGIQFEIPEGVDLDELNQSEALLYSFRARIEDLYLSSIFRTYQNYLLKNPHIVERLQGLQGKIVLTGKVNYNSQGNKIELSWPQLSSNEDLNTFFAEVIKGLESLPNPPKFLFKKSPYFALNYTLFIKGQ